MNYTTGQLSIVAVMIIFFIAMSLAYAMRKRKVLNERIQAEEQLDEQLKANQYFN